MAKVKCENYNLKQIVKSNVWHNPNSYNVLDVAIIYLILFFSLTARQIMTSVIYSKTNINYGFFTLVSLIITQGLIFLIAFIASKIKKVGLFGGSGYSYKFDFMDILFSVVLILAIQMMFSSLHMDFSNDVYFAFYGTMTPDNAIDEELLTPITMVFLMISSFILSPLLPCICEEVLFRGIIMRGLERRGAIFAIIASSVLFSFTHFSFYRMILQFIGGIAIASVVMITKNFLLGAVMHFANNLFAVIFAVIQGIFMSISLRAYYLMSAVYIIFAIIMFTIAFLYFAKKALKNQKHNILHADLYTEKPKYCCLSNKDSINDSYNSVEFNQIDMNKMYKSKKELFYYKGSYYTFNTNKNVILENILLTCCIVFATIMLIIFI